MNFPKFFLQYKSNILTKFFIVVISLSVGSCSMGMTNPDSYNRNHEVYAVDFNPHNLEQLKIFKMDEGDWIAYETVKKGQSDRYTIEVENGFLTVISHKNKMDVPTYQTWLDYARQELGYSVEDEYDIFTTIEEGYIYEIDLEAHPLIEGNEHRILMYEQK
ncbi:hypothetical protein LB467_14740 [Salegentibacter sp. JZCK2]|uniref:hypothetical protein n=1 Tax=Salegentibacter tibetensis TaxID=2873600 RepID=UPI001CCC2FF0|nr:hypothetical protein [Salegentibacter tibetensis]MBZ9730949.1 hypothetical protein [Salegentibacter tibetensis]